MSLASEIDSFRAELKRRLPTYGFFDGLAAALVVGFLHAIFPAVKSPAAKTMRHHKETRRRSISSRITHG